MLEKEIFLDNYDNSPFIEMRERNAVNKDAKNCWEFRDCPDVIREKCPAYVFESGRECWMLAEDFCSKMLNGHFKKCFDCHWFKKLNP